MGVKLRNSLTNYPTKGVALVDSMKVQLLHDAVSQCHSVRACPSANGHSSSLGMLLPINEECRFDELLVRFRRWMGQSDKKERRLDAYNSSTQLRL